MCRVRFDRLRALDDGRVIQFELKATYDPRPVAFRRTFRAQRWDLQAGFYHLGAEDLLGRPPDDVWICAIRRGWPWDVCVHQVKTATLRAARVAARKLLDDIARRTETDSWYSDEETNLQPL